MSSAAYYQLTKPGIIYGNALPLVAGFLLAADWHISWAALASALVGQSLIIASACVVNNIVDRKIDERMERTEKRALVTGEITLWQAAVFAGILGMVGSALLLIGTNVLTLAVGLFGWLMYVIVYGIAKRRTYWGTLVGCVPGALPPVAGYTAVTGRLDMTALLLFIILVCWQMPHFYAIAVFRHKDYAAAKLPVFPVVKGDAAARRHIMIYVFVLTAALLALPLSTDNLGLTYLMLAAGVGGWWIYKGVKSYRRLTDAKWARQMFFGSLVVLMATCVIIPAGTLLP